MSYRMNKLSVCIFLALLVSHSVFAQPTKPRDGNWTEIDPISEFLTRSSAISIGMVDYAHHAINPNLISFIANHYDSFVSGDQVIDFELYRSVNPEIQIYSYFNSFMLGLDQPAPADERAYLHDGSVPASKYQPSNRLAKFFEGEFYYAMDPGSRQWQEHSRTQIEQVLNTGFDGVVIDDVFAHLMHEAHFNTDEPMVIGIPTKHTPFTTEPKWYTPIESHNGWHSYLEFLNQSLAGVVLYNGINDLAENLAPINSALHPSRYLDACDGSIQEGFVYNSKWVIDPAEGFLGDEYWEATVGVLMDIPPEKQHSIVSYGDTNYWPARIYALASYLIGFNQNAEQTFYFTPNEFTLTWLPEWTLDIGNPVDSFRTLEEYKDSSHQIFVRSFERAVVIVNPYGTQTSVIPLGHTYYMVGQDGPVIVESAGAHGAIAIGEPSGLEFEPVRSIQLHGYSAVILMKP